MVVYFSMNVTGRSRYLRTTLIASAIMYPVPAVQRETCTYQPSPALMPNVPKRTHLPPFCVWSTHTFVQPADALIHTGVRVISGAGGPPTVDVVVAVARYPHLVLRGVADRSRDAVPIAGTVSEGVVGARCPASGGAEPIRVGVIIYMRVPRYLRVEPVVRCRPAGAALYIRGRVSVE